MSYPHRIRLRGPWLVEAPGQNSATVRMPCRLGDAGLGAWRGRVGFRRAFGYPGRIDAHERVWLTFAGVEGQSTAVLNDQRLGSFTGRAEFEVTHLLRSRNVLVIEVECTSAAAGLWGEVALEVRATADLRQVRFECAGDRLLASGLAVGRADRPLDLYLLVQGRCLAYQQVVPNDSGQPFTVSAVLEDTASVALPARLELVNGAVVWYVAEGPADSQSGASADSSYS
jgi:hypothetical protein